MSQYDRSTLDLFEASFYISHQIKRIILQQIATYSNSLIGIFY